MNQDAKTSINRRTDIISAAIEVFAEIGYYRATTAQVAQRVQISQPYVFRFFATKEQLLLSALEVSWLRIFESFHQVIESASSKQSLPAKWRFTSAICILPESSFICRTQRP
ncbi:AcrR family transcriptional regulator [Paenibacillus sp. OAE614]